MAGEDKQGSAVRLLAEPLRKALEQCVTRHLGRPWRVTTFEDKADQASHPAAILADETFAVVKELVAALRTYL